MSNCKAVLDACVLVNACLRDTLLRLAEEPRLYIPLWPAEILEETAHTLRGPNFGLTDVQVDRLMGRLESAFPEATVEGYEHLTALMQEAVIRNVITVQNASALSRPTEMLFIASVDHSGFQSAHDVDAPRAPGTIW